MSARAVLTLLLLFLLGTGAAAQQSEARPDDKELTNQLRQAFLQVEGLTGVALQVRGGVAVLRGTVPSLEAKMRAEELAGKLEGVLTVDNGLRVESDVGQRLSPVLEKLAEKTRALVGYLPLLGLAVIAFFFFVSLGKFLRDRDWLYSKISPNLFVQDLAKHAVYLAAVMVGALVALELLDATALVGAVLGTAGVMGIIIGFAFRDMAENSLASVLLSLRQPFAPNDHVVIDSYEGRIVRLTSRSTIILTFDGNHLRIPNSIVFKAAILNYTRNPERRFTFSLGVDVSESLGRAQGLVIKALLEAPGVLEEPPPQCLITELADWSVTLTCYGWVDQRRNDFLKVKSEAVRLVKESLDEAGVVMPEPIQRVRLERLEKPSRGKVEVAKDEEERLPLPDLVPETHLEERVVAERSETEDDLLDAEGKIE